jgi:hypothetical protein
MKLPPLPTCNYGRDTFSRHAPAYSPDHFAETSAAAVRPNSQVILNVFVIAISLREATA